MTNYATDLKEKAEQLNSCFQSVLVQSIPQASGVKTVLNFPQMSDISFCEQGIITVIEKVNVKSAPGPDHISNYVLRNCAASLAPF